MASLTLRDDHTLELSIGIDELQIGRPLRISLDEHDRAQKLFDCVTAGERGRTLIVKLRNPHS